MRRSPIRTHHPIATPRTVCSTGSQRPQIWRLSKFARSLSISMRTRILTFAREHVVFMNAPDILASRIAALRRIVQQSFATANEQSQGFALRLLGPESAGAGTGRMPIDLTAAAESAHYGGVPTVAYLGYGLGHLSNSTIPHATYEVFQQTLARLCSRSGDRLGEFAHDDIAILGVADGLAVLSRVE